MEIQKTKHKFANLYTVNSQFETYMVQLFLFSSHCSDSSLQDKISLTFETVSRAWNGENGRTMNNKSRVRERACNISEVGGGVSVVINSK